MNTPIPTPPPTPPPPTSSSTPQITTTQLVPIPLSQNSTDLILHLDALLELYLSQLDTYTKLRAQLSKHFSNGFLSLAHANRTTTTGRRYGEEGYDGRMKAGRRLKVTGPKDTRVKVEEESGSKHVEDEDDSGGRGKEQVDLKNMADSFEAVSLYPSKFVRLDKRTGLGEDDQSPGPSEDINSSQPAPKPLEEAIVVTGNSKEKTKAENGNQVKADVTKGEEKLKDPILQFGVLVPPSLRAAQNAFTSAVEDIIPDLVTVEKQMAWLGGEVQRMRDLIDSKS